MIEDVGGYKGHDLLGIAPPPKRCQGADRRNLAASGRKTPFRGTRNDPLIFQHSRITIARLMGHFPGVWWEWIAACLPIFLG